MTFHRALLLSGSLSIAMHVVCLRGLPTGAPPSLENRETSAVVIEIPTGGESLEKSSSDTPQGSIREPRPRKIGRRSAPTGGPSMDDPAPVGRVPVVSPGIAESIGPVSPEGTTGVNTGTTSTNAGRPGQGDQSSSSAHPSTPARAEWESIRLGIAGALVYPEKARRLGWEGEALVAFTVLVDGRVDEVSLVKSTGIETLDRSALRAVLAASPFNVRPTPTRVEIPISFSLR